MTKPVLFITPGSRWLARCALALTTVLAGCQSNPYQWDNQAAKRVEHTLDAARREAAGPPVVPAEVNQALLPPIEAGAPKATAAVLEPRFDLSVNNAPARQVFMGLVESTPYSMVVHPDIGGFVTLHLKNVTVPEAMEALRTVYGYEFRRDGNRFFVLGRGMQSRIFPMNYLNLERKGRSLTRVSSGELTQSGVTGGTSGGSGLPGTTGAASGQATASVRVETDSKADFWKELQDSLTAIIGTANGRKVVVNPQAGIVIVRAMPDELHMVDEYLGTTEATVTRQVILEAKVIEVDLNDGYQTGINWAALGANSTFGQVGGGTIFNKGTSETAGNTGILDPGAAFSAISGTNASAFGGVFSVAVKTANFGAFLEFLKTQGNVHVLSSPRVSTVNNQKAVIKVGGDEFFVTSASGGVQGTATTPATPPSVTLTPFFSGISLDVTPQIDDKSNIILHIHPAVSQVTQKDKEFLVGGQAFNLPLASSTIEESDNVVRAANSQIIVIGGLMKEGSNDQDASVPLLGDIPILGNAFKHKLVTRIKKELVILLKPTLVDNGQTWETAIQESQGRIQKLKR